MTDPADGHFLPRALHLSSFEEQDASALAAINGSQPLNPAQAYLIGLSSSASRKTMRSFLNIVAGMLGFSSMQSCAWGSLRRHHVRGLLEMLAASGRAPATINTYLSALKGTAREAWMMKQTDTESYQQIQAVRAVREAGWPVVVRFPRKKFMRCSAAVKRTPPAEAHAMRPCWR